MTRSQISIDSKESENFFQPFNLIETFILPFSSVLSVAYAYAYGLLSGMKVARAI